MAEIISKSLGDAWGAAVAMALKCAHREVSPLTVTIRLEDEQKPEKVGNVRKSLNAALLAKQKATVETVASTIFPASLWNASLPRSTLYARYRAILPRIRKYNPRGTYFQRLIAYREEAAYPGINQLEKIIQIYHYGNPRRSAFQLCVWDPERDLSNSRRLGFPCLQQVAFAPDRAHGTLTVTAFYAMQYLFERAYGNYLGIERLGKFVAHETGLRLTSVTCVAAVAKLEAGIRALRTLVEK